MLEKVFCFYLLLIIFWVFSQANDNQQYLGDGLGAIPEFPTIKLNSFLEETDVTLEDVDTLRNIYREHCEAFLEAVLNLEFQTIESLWREFWRSQDNNNGDECEEEKYLSKYALLSILVENIYYAN